ncbi:MAG: SDR family oxidoreductase [Thermoanaerobaculia bacterium]
MGELEERTAIVTGASSGIGLATAERLAREGARVVVFARSKEKLEELAARDPERFLAVPGDLSEPASVEALFHACEERFGPCDILVNNAGTSAPRPLTEMAIADWDRVFNVNIRGMFLTCRRALPAMLERRRGVIVNVASISGVPGPRKFPGSSAYCASKGAVISFTDALSVEVSPYGVRVNAVSPGSVDTPMLREALPDLVPDMGPSEVAEVILFLASDRSRPLNGQNIHVYHA